MIETPGVGKRFKGNGCALKLKLPLLYKYPVGTGVLVLFSKEKPKPSLVSVTGSLFHSAGEPEEQPAASQGVLGILFDPEVSTPS